jgi:hypothetical protein
MHTARAVGAGYPELGQLEMETQNKGSWRWINKARAVGVRYTELGHLEMDTKS